MRRARLAVSMLLAVGGCSQYWAKPGGTAAEFNITKDRCDGTSFNQFPPLYQTVLLNPGYVAPFYTSCVPGLIGPRCFTSAGQFIPANYSVIDINRRPRENALRMCLIAAGWRPTQDREEAEAITRSAPPASKPAPEAAINNARAYCEALIRRRPGAMTTAANRTEFEQCVGARVLGTGDS